MLILINIFARIILKSVNMNFKIKALTAGVLFFTGQAVMAQKDSLKTKNIDEVVLVGYGTQKKSEVTGSIATIKSDVCEECTVTWL